jgi:hypothetical protein
MCDDAFIISGFSVSRCWEPSSRLWKMVQVHGISKFFHVGPTGFHDWGLVLCSKARWVVSRNGLPSSHTFYNLINLANTWTWGVFFDGWCGCRGYFCWRRMPRISSPEFCRYNTRHFNVVCLFRLQFKLCCLIGVRPTLLCWLEL